MPKALDYYETVSLDRNTAKGVSVFEGEMSKQLNTDLFDMIAKEMAEYSAIGTGKFFGLDVLKVQGETFAMVWKEGRVGVKILNKELNAKLVSTKEANHWVTSGKTMSQWVLAPYEYNEDITALKKWLLLAYNDALTNKKH
ncbi:MAG: hypothetical protein COB61_012220 [Thiotrichales bacterium]|nr:hypothetical protein [Thiotrichales bacterium]